MYDQQLTLAYFRPIDLQPHLKAVWVSDGVPPDVRCGGKVCYRLMLPYILDANSSERTAAAALRHVVLC
jgi:hypothetical protein